MNANPSITVLTTVFNAGRFFDASIRSILNQTFKDFEFLIVDDASSDGSAELAEDWAKKDSRVRVIRNEANKGQTPCLNQGLRLARGKWIARQDADDLSHPIRLTRQYEHVLIHPEIALLGSNGRIIDEGDRLVGLLDAPVTKESIRWTAPFLNPFMHTAVLFRTDLVRDEFGGYDESFRIAQDYDLWAKILVKYPVCNLPDRLVAYRHLATSLSKAGRGTAFAEASRVSQRLASELFQRNFTGEEIEAIASFRQGLSVGERNRFWKLYESLKRSHTKPDNDLSRTVALHHLKAAGALPKHLAIAEILSALSASPMITLGWLKERFL